MTLPSRKHDGPLKTPLRETAKVAGVLGVLGVGVLVGSTDWLAAFGARPSGERLQRIIRSPQWRGSAKDGAFENSVPTAKMLPNSMLNTAWRQVAGGEQRTPPKAIPVRRLTRADFTQPPPSGLRATWLGHATTLVEIDGARVLLDPVWAERASPSRLVGPSRFHAPPLPIGDVPPLDAVVISHDHYDHLDMDAVRALANDPNQPCLRFVVPLGVGAHLERWGVAPARIVELDWGESAKVGGINASLSITATPARHYSGRGLGRDNQTLWASFVIAGTTSQGGSHRVFYSGDTGAFDGFTKLGKQHGPFDLTIVKMGAYGPTWPDIHLTPEQAVAVHQQVGGRMLLPVHWGTFNLAFHPWEEPAEHVLEAARVAGVRVVLPRPGEPVEPDASPATLPEPIDAWWRQVVSIR
ncbi:L-ascorbate metabolism protein UlaG, beta-lactamase superfamily [Sphingomonas rubra]|uniref:L-ascorbate metabolism protein UlaG, beta-lactamase superfamily n=1 Tax=Sphingomonas rubra TaxID=634430 RepID=A0A1I5UM84_9SPHN|nr:L-ascorbate metabolism protein UlaG, beta-lactamase superfamily [Sphingomonas rubra]